MTITEEQRMIAETFDEIDDFLDYLDALPPDLKKFFLDHSDTFINDILNCLSPGYEGFDRPFTFSIYQKIGSPPDLCEFADRIIRYQVENPDAGILNGYLDDIEEYFNEEEFDFDFWAGIVENADFNDSLRLRVLELMEEKWPEETLRRFEEDFYGFMANHGPNKTIMHGVIKFIFEHEELVRDIPKTYQQIRNYFFKYDPNVGVSNDTFMKMRRNGVFKREEI